MKKKICFYTGNRGEFSLIKPLIQKVIEIEEIHEQILVSGSHLEIEYGETIKEILNSKILPLQRELLVLMFGPLAQPSQI